MKYGYEDKQVIKKKKSDFERLSKLVNETNGLLGYKIALKEGICTEQTRQFIHEMDMIEVAPGVYALDKTYPDKLYAMQQSFTKGVYSHETALYLWGLSDVKPETIYMTFPSGHSNRAFYQQEITHKISADSRYPIGLTSIETQHGNEIKLYNRERTLCDLFQKRHRANKELVLQGMKEYLSSDVKNSKLLLEYSKLFRVETSIRYYMESYI